MVTRGRSPERHIAVSPLAHEARDGAIRCRARLEGLGPTVDEIWFEFADEHAGLITDRADPWAVCLVVPAMADGAALVIDGAVSRSLLANLERVVETWARWEPSRYAACSMRAAREVEDDDDGARLGSVALIFSGRLDDCHVALRHTRALAGRRTRTLTAGLLVVDAGGRPLHPDALPDITDSQALLADLGLPLWVVRTNACDLSPPWAPAIEAIEAAALHWLGGGVRAGIMSGGRLDHLDRRTGAHPLTVPDLGGGRVQIICDGAGEPPSAKARLVATWPAAVRRLAWPEMTSGLGTLALRAWAARTGLAPEPPVDWAATVSLDDDGQRDAAGLLADLADGDESRPAWATALRARLAPPSSPIETGPAWPPRGRTAHEIHVTPEPPHVRGDWLVVSARIDGLGDRSRRLWFAAEPGLAPLLSPLADPFVCALQIPAMRAGAALIVHGRASRKLLENLEAFQEVWHVWAPDELTPVPLRVTEEVEGSGQTDTSVLLFSGGLDSCFSAYRHCHGLVGRRTRRPRAGLMVHGLDIFIPEAAGYHGALARARRMLRSLGIECWSMATNFRDIVGEWEAAHGSALAACAHCLAGGVGTAVISSSAPVTNLDQPWGTHVLTDRLLSSDRLQVETDGASVPRGERPPLVARWPEAMRDLRVCYVDARGDRNCGRCSKCLWTALGFLSWGLPLPDSLPPPAPALVAQQSLPLPWQRRAMEATLARAEAAGLGRTGWARALRDCVDRNRAGLPPAVPAPPLLPRVRRRVRRTVARVVRSARGA